ncbi:MAG: [protein-PII] uridylyltransferase [Gammaproteobacteria bacterium]|nr:[protein-PII] uridylyltransferase [Gammaproteobacteria bacterium]
MSTPNATTWRATLKEGRAAVFEAYLARPRAHVLLSDLTHLTDQVLRDIWQAHDLPEHAALVAVGGYGRSEMYPQSDVDVLILFDDALPDAEHARFEPLIGLFWDVGLPIGHSVRRLSECLSESAGDITIQTNLLEARHLAGDPALFQRMRQGLVAQMNPVTFYQAKALEQKARHGRHADVALLLEPNLKESPGGLRDIQTLFWVCRAAGLAQGQGHSIKDLVGAGLLCEAEARALRADYALLANLRIRLHLAINRREDRMLYEFQERIAAAMGIANDESRRASERMMQRYYRASRRVSLINNLVMGELRDRLQAPPAPRDLPGQTGFRAVGNLLDAEEDQFARDPDSLLEAFLVLSREHTLVGCTPRLLRALSRAGRLINADFRHDPGNHARFLELLREPHGVSTALRLMHRLGILGRYIPLFGRITGQMQHDQFHIYPVDEHTLMVLRNLRRLALSEFAHEFPLAHRLMSACQRPDLLYLAALFHDIAKGRGGDHSTLGTLDARRFCLSQGLPLEEAELVAWLVAEHLMLSQTAQKQDLSDPDVILAFAARCGDVKRLTALYLLTISDIRGTSPKVWNAWKDKLTRELYLAARRVLEGGAPQIDSVEEKKELARTQLRLYGYPNEAEAAFWKRLDDVYFLRQDARDIAWQTRRLLPLLNRQKLIVSARLAPVGEGVEVMVYAPDEEALFARICAFFARLGYSILASSIHTTSDGHALDTFYALDPEHPQVPYRDFLNYIEHELSADLAAHQPLGPPLKGRLARRLKAFPLEPEVSLTPSDNRRDYLLTFTAGDRPGLLAQVARVLTEHRASVITARISTLGQRAEDVFVLEGEVLEKTGKRLALEKALLDALKVQ